MTFVKLCQTKNNKYVEIKVLPIEKKQCMNNVFPPKETAATIRYLTSQVWLVLEGGLYQWLATIQPIWLLEREKAFYNISSWIKTQ